MLTLASLFPLRSKKLKLTKKYFDDLAKNESRSGKWNAIGGGLYVCDVSRLSELLTLRTTLVCTFGTLAALK